MIDLGCVPTSMEACKEVAARLNKPIEFGNYGTKGCYAYASGQHANTIWYGMNGGVDHITEMLPSERGSGISGSNEHYRPLTYDCTGS